MGDFSVIQDKIAFLQNQIDELKLRNVLKDKDKAFESSWTRRIAIVVLTYGTLFTYMWGIGVNQPALNAIVPAVGFTLSTLSLPYLKYCWEYCQFKHLPEEDRRTVPNFSMR